MSSHSEANLKLTLHVPPGAKEALTREAEKRGLTRNAFIVELLSPYIPKTVKQQRIEQAAAEFDKNMRSLGLNGEFEKAAQQRRPEAPVNGLTVGYDVTEDGRYVRQLLRREKDAGR